MAEEQDQSQRTEQPTPHRLEKARKEGQIALSREVMHFLMVLAFSLIILMMLPWIAMRIMAVLRMYLEQAAQVEVGTMMTLIRQSLVKIGTTLTAPFLLLLLAALVGSFAQTRFLITTAHLKPKLRNLSPLQGLKRLFGAKSLIEFLKTCLKLAILGSMIYWIVHIQLKEVSGLMSLPMGGFLGMLKGEIATFLFALLALLAVMAILDYGYQKFFLMRQLRMSRHEIREEFKELEGDPHVRSRQRSLRESRARQRMMAAVPSATVVITNPTHYAVALKFEMGAMEAPEVVAKGLDTIAQRMIELAKENDVPLIENPPLARALFADVAIGKQIPVKYYEAVARIIRFVLGYDKTPPRAGL